MSEKLPWFRFYPFDWETDSDVIMMSSMERGIYITLLNRCWIDGGIPIDFEEINDEQSDDQRTINGRSTNVQRTINERSTDVQRALGVRLSFDQPRIKRLLSGSFGNDFRELVKMLPVTFEQMDELYTRAILKVAVHFRHPTETPGYFSNEKLESLRGEQKKKIVQCSEAGGKGKGKSKGKTTAKRPLNERSTDVQRTSNEPEPQPYPYNCSSSGTIGRAREGDAESPSLEQAKQFAEMQAIPAPLVESWYSKNEMKHWEILATGNRWEKALMAYWKAIPPKAQAEWREKPANGRKIISADKTNRPDKPQIRPENITTL